MLIVTTRHRFADAYLFESSYVTNETSLIYVATYMKKFVVGLRYMNIKCSIILMRMLLNRIINIIIY